MSHPDFSKLTGEEAEDYIRKEFWPDCFMHYHGHECTIISHNGDKVRELRNANPKFKYVCGPQRLIDYRLSREQQKPKEDYLWRLTAAWCYEMKLSGKLVAVTGE